MITDLTPDSLELLKALWKDAPNWGGTPLFGGNVGGSPESLGNLTDLKKKGYVQTEQDGDDPSLAWVIFTDRARAALEVPEPGTRVMVATQTYGRIRPYTLRSDSLGFYVRCGKRGSVKEYLIRRDRVDGLTTYRSAPADSEAWKAAEWQAWMNQ